ncbi:YcaO-like family protein [Bradyrhizobium sp. BRP22]|nr:YcaO-like family protein [Bradyrhizobium sp. BRP22]
MDVAGTGRAGSISYSSATEIDFRELPDRATGEPARDLETLVDQVAGTGHDVLAADLTTEDVAAPGFHVIRALIPGYHPMFMGYASRALGRVSGNCHGSWAIPA